MDVLLIPSARSCENASSRLGPMLPVVLAWARVWQTPHLVRNSCLPWTRLGTGCLTWQPPAATTSKADSASVPSRLRWLSPPTPRRTVANMLRGGTLSQADAPVPHRSGPVPVRLAGGCSPGPLVAWPPNEDAPEVPDEGDVDRPFSTLRIE